MNQEATPSRRWLWGCSDQATARDRRNLRHVNYWLFGWMVVFLVSLMVMEGPGDTSLGVATLTMVTSALAFIPVFFAYRRFLGEADELTRLIHLRAMAAAFVAGIFMGFLERFLERVVSFLPSTPIGIEASDIFNPLMAMIITYAVASVIGQRRYR